MADRIICQLQSGRVVGAELVARAADGAVTVNYAGIGPQPARELSHADVLALEARNPLLHRREGQ